MTSTNAVNPPHIQMLPMLSNAAPSPSAALPASFQYEAAAHAAKGEPDGQTRGPTRPGHGPVAV